MTVFKSKYFNTITLGQNYRKKTDIISKFLTYLYFTFFLPDARLPTYEYRVSQKIWKYASNSAIAAQLRLMQKLNKINWYYFRITNTFWLNKFSARGSVLYLRLQGVPKINENTNFPPIKTVCHLLRPNMKKINWL